MFKLRSLVMISALKCKRTFSSTYILKPLKERTLLKVVGEETPNYLQGLITNDVQHISDKNTSQYAMFLNSKGRVLYDTIIYRIDQDIFVLECDKSIAEVLEKHLKQYKLRRKIDVTPLNSYIYSLFNRDAYDRILQNKGSLECQELMMNDSISQNIDIPNISIFRDPRVSLLGYRILALKETNIMAQLSEFINIDPDSDNSFSYRKYRYMLGIGEGVQDLPCGNCFPLESNCDYLHGVSFHKGCYIGQELTARTYHTGVTRKRLMPIYFKEPITQIGTDDSITHEKMKLGKLRGIDGNVGLGLLRIDLVNSIQSIVIDGVEICIGKPFWWPIEAPKEKLNIMK